MFRDRVMVIEDLMRDYILGQVLHRDNRFGMGYSTNDRHYITLRGEMLVQSCPQLTSNPILKLKVKSNYYHLSFQLQRSECMRFPDSNNIYELKFSTFQLPEGVATLDVMHCVNHKTPRMLKVPILNTNSVKVQNCWFSAEWLAVNSGSPFISGAVTRRHWLQFISDLLVF